MVTQSRIFAFSRPEIIVFLWFRMISLACPMQGVMRAIPEVTNFNDKGDPVSFDVSLSPNRSLLEKQFNKLQLYKLIKNLYIRFKGLNKF